jgi:hypothetical protein
MSVQHPTHYKDLPGNYLIVSGRESIRCCQSPSLACEVVARIVNILAGDHPLTLGN